MFSVYSNYSLYIDNPKAPLMIMISMSLLAFFYLIYAFYKIFLGILGKSTPFSLVSVFAFFGIALISTGAFAAIFVYPASKVIVGIGLFSAIGCMALTAKNRDTYEASDSVRDVKWMIGRLLFFSLISFFILRTSTTQLYSLFGPLKNDAKAKELLEECGINKKYCEEFYQYQNKKMSERWN